MRRLVASIVVLLSSVLSPVTGRSLSSEQLVVGEWRVTLRGGRLFDPSSLFPSSEITKISMKRRPWRSASMDCTCSLCDDGTFSLTPLISATTNPNDILPLRGRWKVLANPYCVTDRFYDQLTLESYPRKCVDQHDKILDINKWTMHCRLWGRYSRQKQRQGRMTHGSLSVSSPSTSLARKQQPWWKPRKSIIASFTAFRDSNEPILQGWEDKQYFGY